jgi:NADH dehydrogenase [ubiquinone] 1 alpha subcomplex assembly factor 1
MGNLLRMMKYDRATNERSAIPVLNFLEQELSWFRLDDGVMGGQSSTSHQKHEDETLDFGGTINTNGGGFCSIRANFQGLPENTKAIRIRYTGDGKTYKFLLSDGNRGFSMLTWQYDIPTDPSKEEQIIEIDLQDLKASMGPRPVPSNTQFSTSSMNLMGIMLSLKLSDGEPNPVETFGSGIFPFSFKIHSIEPVTS